MRSRLPRTISNLLLGAGVTLALPALAGPASAPSPATATTRVTVQLQPAKKASKLSDEATTVYLTRCVVCHGAAGDGDGVAAMGMNPKPRSFGDPAWHRASKDAAILKAIREGGAAVGKSPLMPANPDLSPELAAELVRLIRGQRSARVHVELRPKGGEPVTFTGLMNIGRTVQLAGVPLGPAQLSGFIDVDGDGARGKKEPVFNASVKIEDDNPTLTVRPR